jgi:CTP synthase
MKKVKYIFVTGGVLSSLGKGIASASMGFLLKARGLRVNIQKFDPYLNVDPGTMSPFQHGEVFVTDDGAETDLDLGHYERFIDRNLTQDNNVTAGQVYEAVIMRERRGDYLGKTVQVIPHVTDEIKSRIRRLATKDQVDVVITEIGGTVGDIEGLPFLEAIRQFRLDHGRENTLFIHLTFVPHIRVSGELKTKPTQHSVRELLEVGIQPDILLCRTEKALTQEMRDKIGLFCNVPPEAVIEARDVETIYEIPLRFHADGLDSTIASVLDLGTRSPELEHWKGVVERIKHPRRTVRIGMCGKYVHLKDAYKSIIEAFVHAGIANDARVELEWVDTEALETNDGGGLLGQVSGILVPGGFGERGIEGKVKAAEYARRQKVPYLGICYGLHWAAVEFARNVCGLAKATSAEVDPLTPDPVIHLLPEQENIVSKGHTMRLGAYPCRVRQGTRAFAAYGQDLASERHRHRYEFNNKYREMFERAGMVISGTSPDDRLVEMLELRDHPWFVAGQFHPELKSRPLAPHPLFRDFVRASLDYQEQKGCLSRPFTV